MLYKNYIITAMSILEGLFSNILKSRNLWSTEEYEQIGEFKSNPKNINAFGDEQFLVVTRLMKKSNCKKADMTLDSMIKKLDKRHEILGIDNDIYPALNRMRELRNKVHLQSSNNPYDHDYNAFNYKEFIEIRTIIFNIFTSDKVVNDPTVFSFLGTEIKSGPEDEA